VNFSKLLLDVITITNEVDSQLKQATLCCVESEPGWEYFAASQADGACDGWQ
jgi:hypothetical protein